MAEAAAPEQGLCREIALAQQLFVLRNPDVPGDKAALTAALLADVCSNDLAPLYAQCCERLGWSLDAAKLAQMQARNAQTLKELVDRVSDAVANLGETEVREALLAKATFFVKIGDKAAAEAAFAETEKKTVALGQKMDLVFSLLRLHFMFGDFGGVKNDIRKLKDLLETPGGGDWERKNRLKVYEGVYAMATRDFSKAAHLFLDSLSTFTATELCSYNQFIFYTVITAVVALDRVALKQRVVDAPEILAVLGQLPHVEPFLNGLYACNYKDFMVAFPGVADQVRADMHLRAHFRYFLREARMAAYAQFLESYKSVTLQMMASAFGVSPAFLDGELSDFIAAGRLNCKIDKVAGVLETNRPDVKSALYQAVIKQGDLLLNRIQRLGRTVD